MKKYQVYAAIFALVVSKLVFSAHPGADLTFGSAGIATAPATNVDLALKPYRYSTISRVAGNAGKWYAFTHNRGDYTVARFDGNGHTDSVFGTAGVYQAGFVGAIGGRGLAMALDGREKPLIAAGTNNSNATILQLQRLTQSGERDQSFGVDGYASITFPVIVTDNGTIPVSPTRVVPRTGGGAFVIMARSAVVAINDQGGVDTTFANQGFYFASSTVIASSQYQDTVLAVSNDGVVYVLRQTATGPRIVRYLLNGSLDLAYGSAVTTNAWPPDSAFLDGNNNLLLSFNQNIDLIIFKFNPQGQLISSFGTDGAMTVPSSFPNIASLADIGSDGSLLVITAVSSQQFTSPVTIRLFDQTGKVILGFGGKGVSRLEYKPIDGRSIYSVNAQFDDANRLIVLGVGQNTSESIRAVRLNRDFKHVAKLTSPMIGGYLAGIATAQTQFQYGDAIVVDSFIEGDSGLPSGLMRVDAGTWFCTVDNINFGDSPPKRVGCALRADALGTYSWRLIYLGDDIYGSVELGGGEHRSQQAKDKA
jgi:hypothetical protein